MRQVLVNMFLSLDGVLQAPGGPEEDTSDGFAYGGWSAPHWDDAMGDVLDDAFAVPFDLLLGRRTYEIFASYWPTAPDEAGPTKAFNQATKYVASRGSPSLDWGPAVLIDDAVEGVAELKKDHGPELQVHGSGKLIQTLMRNGLVDVYRLWFFPVVIGSGKRFFEDGALPATWKLVDQKMSTTGVYIGTYEPAGELVTGTVGAS